MPVGNSVWSACEARGKTRKETVRQCAPRLARRLQEEREAAGMSMYALGRQSGVSREMVSCIEDGDSIFTLFVIVRLAHGMGMTLTEFVGKLEDGGGQ